MTGELRIDVAVDSTAAPDAVWKLVADVTTWKDWGPWDRAELERPGVNNPAGVGALRRFRYLRRITREEVVGFDPPHRYAYELRSGLPLRNYHAEVTVVPSGAGSRLEWHAHFDATVLGRLWRPGLARFIRTVATRLVRAAEAS